MQRWGPSRLRRHRRFCPSSLCLKSNQRWSVNQTQECIYQLPWYALWRGCRHHHTSPCDHRQWPHLRLLWAWEEEGVGEGDGSCWGKRAPGTSGWESGVERWSESGYENICSLNHTVRVRVSHVDRPELPSGTSWRRSVRFVSHLMRTPWIVMWKGQTTLHIASSTTTFKNILPPLAMAGN